MALPILGLAAGIAARAAAKKAASRAVGGIVGKGSKQVNPVYRNQTDQIQKNSVKVQKNSFDTYSKALGGGTLREIHGRMTKRINSAGLEKARSKGPRPSVKVVPSKTAPKTGLENRGNKVSRSDRRNTANEMLWEKAERSYEGGIDTMAAGMKGPKMGMLKGAGKKNQRKIDNLKKAAKPVVKINSALPKRGK